MIKLKLDGKIAWISISRPNAHNAINTEVLEKLAEYLEICAGKKIGSIVLRGEGNSFCSGADLIEFKKFLKERKFKHYSRLFNDVILKLRNMDKVVIVEAKGYVFGAGLSLLLASDYAIASENTIFSSGFARIGLSPDTGSSFFLPRTVGFKKAFELMASARNFDANEALSLGLINEVVEIDRLEDRTEEVAKLYAEIPNKVVHHIKQLLNVSLSNKLDEHLLLEEELILDTAKSKDFVEKLEEVIKRIKDKN